MNRQHDVARDDKTHGPAEEGVAGEMITGGDTREANDASQAIGHKGNPTMLPISVREDGSDGGGRHSMVGKKASGLKWIV